MNLKRFLKRYRVRLGGTLFLILTEAALTVLFPLFIGFAIDGALNGNYSGTVYLGLLGLATLMVGVGRRVLDSRFYAQLYQSMGYHAMSSMKDNLYSKKSAHLGMIRELVEFLENSFPELINTIIGLVGILGMIATLNWTVFYGSLLVALIIVLIYWLTSAQTIQLNKSFNDEFEQQVDVLSSNDPPSLRLHLKNMMQWNIKLSDLEALNFSLSWLVLMVFLMVAILISVHDGLVKYGALFSLILYIFQYIEHVVHLPFFYQNFLRLQEITERLEEGL